MGMISIKIEGSFGDKGTSVFSAEEGGHAYAITRAVAYLMINMKDAIKLDHKLHDEGSRPPKSDFGHGNSSKN